jgi:hypothetical protein
MESERSALAHGHWGIADIIEDGILWISAEDNILFHVDYAAKVVGAKRKLTGSEFHELLDKVFVYTKKDFEEIESNLNNYRLTPVGS